MVTRRVETVSRAMPEYREPHGAGAAPEPAGRRGAAKASVWERALAMATETETASVLASRSATVAVWLLAAAPALGLAGCSVLESLQVRAELALVLEVEFREQAERDAQPEQAPPGEPLEK
jgi:hypothetical protein